MYTYEDIIKIVAAQFGPDKVEIEYGEDYNGDMVPAAHKFRGLDVRYNCDSDGSIYGFTVTENGQEYDFPAFHHWEYHHGGYSHDSGNWYYAQCSVCGLQTPAYGDDESPDTDSLDYSVPCSAPCVED